MTDSKHAWHYTTSGGLIGMLTRHRVWATSAAYMNDRAEIKAGLEALAEAMKRRTPPLDPKQVERLGRMGALKSGDPHSLFLLCASTDGDALTLWRSYGIGSEAEYAVDFRSDVSLLPIQQNDAPGHPEPTPPGWGDDAYDYTDEGERFRMYEPDQAMAFGGPWQDVSYLKPTSTAAADELERLIGLLVPGSGNRIPFNDDYRSGPDPTTTYKHHGFEDEKEVRALWTVSPWWRFVLYRPGRFGITPYIEVGQSLDEDTQLAYGAYLDSKSVGKLPIRSVRIGPTRAADDAKKSLRALLDATGYGDVSIEISSTPYR